MTSVKSKPRKPRPKIKQKAGKYALPPRELTKHKINWRRQKGVTIKALYTFIFAHPKDRVKAEVSYDCWREKQPKDGTRYFARIRMSEIVTQGEWGIATEEFDLAMVSPDEIGAKVADKFADWLAVEKAKPRGPTEIRLPYPFERQKTIIYTKKRYKVMVCGRRFGKTTSALLAAILRATAERDQVIFYIAPTYRQAKQVAWGILTRWVGGGYLRKNEQELVIEFANGSKIFLKGAENPDSLRGSFCHLAILDEYSDIRPNVWDEVVSPLLLDTRGDAWFMGTPKGFDHFHKLWKEVHSGERGEEWVAFRLTSYDNPYNSREELAEKKRTTDARYFAQEYMAEFIQFSGLVFADFNRERHVKDFNVEEVNGIYLEGMDFGADHPTACIFGKVDATGKLWVWAEHYESNMSSGEHAKAIKAKRIETKPGVYKRRPRATYLDPSAKGFSNDLAANGIRTVKAVNDRDFGVARVRELLRDDRIVIHPSCVNLIYEFEHHVYKDKIRSSDGRDAGDLVKKVDDDALDALRYMVASYLKKGKALEEPLMELPAETRGLRYLEPSAPLDPIATEFKRFM